MYFIEKENDLIGKKITFTHMAQFAEAITIVTEDQGIMVVEQDYDETHIKKTYQAKEYILKHKYLREELSKSGVLTQQDIDEYEEKQRREREEMLEANKRRKETQDRQEYARLKLKFEGVVIEDVQIINSGN